MLTFDAGLLTGTCRPAAVHRQRPLCGWPILRTALGRRRCHCPKKRLRSRAGRVAWNATPAQSREECFLAASNDRLSTTSAGACHSTYFTASRSFMSASMLDAHELLHINDYISLERDRY